MVGQRSNQLNYVPTRQINKMRNRQCLCGFAQIAYRALLAFPCLKERFSRLNQPPPNRPQTSERTFVLPRTIRGDGQEENKGKPRENILTASLSVRKVTPRFLAPGLLTKRCRSLRDSARFVIGCTWNADSKTDVNQS